MDVPEEITIRAFLPGIFSVANFFNSPQPKSILVGMCILNIELLVMVITY